MHRPSFRIECLGTGAAACPPRTKYRVPVAKYPVRAISSGNDRQTRLAKTIYQASVHELATAARRDVRAQRNVHAARTVAIFGGDAATGQRAPQQLPPRKRHQMKEAIGLQ
eukprot:7319274-Pyramimonas_sp.AAC.1